MPLQDKKQIPLPAWPIYIFLHTSFLSQDTPDDWQILTSVLPLVVLVLPIPTLHNAAEKQKKKLKRREF